MRIADALHDPRDATPRAVAAVAISLLTIVALLAIGGTTLEAIIFGLGALGLTLVFARNEALSVARALEAGRQLATHDSVTDLPSSEFADHFVSTEFAAAQRGRAVTVVLFGFDQFDAFMASHGPAVADSAVREFGRILKRLTRKMNHSARYGWRADAFLSVLSDADMAAATIYVQRVRTAVDEAAHVAPMPTLSIGVAEFQPDFATPAEFVEAAERALAEARADGGDCVRFRRAPLTAGEVKERVLKAL